MCEAAGHGIIRRQLFERNTLVSRELGDIFDIIMHGIPKWVK